MVIRTYWKELSIIIPFIGLYSHIIIEMVKDWELSDNSHGYLIPFISLYLLWEEKEKISQIKIKPANIGIVVMLCGLFLSVLGIIAVELYTMRFSMIIVIIGIIYFLYGKEIVKSVLLPVGYLVFMIPIPAIIFNSVAFPLKLFAARISTDIIQLLNIPVFREGNIIQLAGITLEVADACSGIRSLMAMIALGIAYAHFSQNSIKKKILLVVLAVPITVFANVIRVTGTGIMSHYIGAAAAMGFFHEFAGMLIFGVAFSLLLFVGIFLKRV